MKRGGYKMKRYVLIVLAALLIAFVANSAVWAQPKGNIELKAVAEVEMEVVNAKGEKELKRVPAASVVPGDFVIYTIYYANVGKEPADKVVIINPVPEHMRYEDGSASGEGTRITFSVDDGKTYELPEKLTVVDADGKMRPAKGSDYTHIRWTLQKSLAPEEKGIVNFRAQLE
jgi:uncharacterized repeat protein (TIGR01451 family)